MARKNDDHKEPRFCPFKKAVSVEYSAMTARKTMHERFEECAGERCMAYIDGYVPKCRRLEGNNGNR